MLLAALTGRNAGKGIVRQIVRREIITREAAVHAAERRAAALKTLGPNGFNSGHPTITADLETPACIILAVFVPSLNDQSIAISARFTKEFAGPLF